MVCLAQLQAAIGDVADAAPAGIAGFENLVEYLAGLVVAVRLDHPAVLGFNPGLSGNHLAGQHQDPLQNVQRFKTGDHTGNPESLCQRPIGVGTDNGRDMSRAEVAVNLKLRVACQGRHGRGHRLV